MSVAKHDDPKAMSWGHAFGLSLVWMLVSLIPTCILTVILANSEILPPPDDPNGPYHAVRLGIALYVFGVPVMSSRFHKSWKLAVAFAVDLVAISACAGTLLLLFFLRAPQVWH